MRRLPGRAPTRPSRRTTSRSRSARRASSAAACRPGPGTRRHFTMPPLCDDALEHAEPAVFAGAVTSHSMRSKRRSGLSTPYFSIASAYVMRRSGSVSSTPSTSRQSVAISSPLQRSSATPIAATGRSSGWATADEPADERQPQAAVVAPCGPNASRMSRSWRPRWRKPRRSRPVARCSSGKPDSATEPALGRRRSSSPPRQPNPAANGKQASRARLGQQALARERLAARRSRTARRISRRAASFAIPKPPPCLRAKAAIVRSPRRRASGRQVAAQVGVAEQERRPARPRARRA